METDGPPGNGHHGEGARAGETPFWRVRPAAAHEPAGLRAHGERCGARADGRGMLAAGWALLELAGPAADGATGLLRSGFATWRESPDYDGAAGVAFLFELLERLAATEPPLPSDASATPPEALRLAVAHCTLRTWAAITLLEELPPDAPGRARREDELYAAIRRAEAGFAPPEAIDWARRYATRRGLPEPF